MNINSLVDALLHDTLQVSVPLFRPELTICATIVLLLLIRIFTRTGSAVPFVVALLGSLTALWFSIPAAIGAEDISRQEIFTGMLVYDSVTAYIRILLLVFAVLFILLCRLTGIADREDSQDFYALMLGATLGMCIMASSNHLMTIFLGVEMASVPSYVLAGIVKGRRRASEAALKYAIYGAGAAGVMLYGISLLAGVLGSAHLPTMAQNLAEMDIASMMQSSEGHGTIMVLILAGLMTMAGLAFKLSAVPFHFWCPDVFEGAAAEVGAFLSVASKAAALALLVRVAIGFGTLPATAEALENEPDQSTPVAQSQQLVVPVVSVALSETRQIAEEGEESPSDSIEQTPDASTDGLSPVRAYLVRLIAIIAMISCTFGNLAAYGQTNIKRMLAYSTIAHAGYMMMAVAAAIAMAEHGSGGGAIAALLIYITIYLFMNLGVFAIVAFLRGAMGSEEIADYSGLIRSCPVVSVCMVLLLFSLIGLPPLAGFIGKLFIFASLYEAGGAILILTLVVGGLNTVISLIYYLRVAKVICVDPEPDSRGPVALGMLSVAYVCLITFPVVVLGILPEQLRQAALSATKHILVGSGS